MKTSQMFPKTSDSFSIKLKTMFLVILFVFAVCSANAQLYKFTGTYSGTVTLKDGSRTKIRLRITSDNVTQYFYNDDNDSWYPASSDISRYAYDKNNLIYYWINTGGVWTETQTFMLSYVNSRKLYLVWSRQVVNEKDDDDNDAWSLQGAGYLYQE